MRYRCNVKAVGLNGFAVVGASLMVCGDQGSRCEAIEGISSKAGTDVPDAWNGGSSMTELRESMIADMTAAGLSAATKEVYVRGLVAKARRSHSASLPIAAVVSA